MLFAAHAAREIDRERMDRLGELLGVIWTREQAQALTEAGKSDRKIQRKPRDRMFIPLLPGFNPKILEFVRKGFGSATGIDAPNWYKQDHSEVVEAFELPRDEFLRIASLFTPLIPKTT